MEIVGKVAATIQNVLGPEAEELGRATGVIQRRRKFTAVSLLRMLVLTLLRKPMPSPPIPSSAAQLGLDVTSMAVENRFTPQLVGFLRAVLEHTVLRVLAASPQTVDLLNKFTSVRIGDSIPSHCPTNWPTSSPAVAASCAGAGRDEDPPAVGLPHRLDPPTANHPRHASDATNPIAQEVAPAGSLSLFYLLPLLVGSGTSRGPVLFGSLGCSMARRSSTPRASPWRCCNTCGSRQGRDRSTCRSCWA